MQATAIALAIGIAASAQQAPPKKVFAEGQEVRICGEVKTQRTSPPACDTTIRVLSAGEEFDILVPASVVKELGVAPQRMRGAEACFTGRIVMTPGAPRLTVASRAGVEVIGTRVDANFGADAAIPCGQNVTMPQVLKEQKPQYTQNAMRERAQGTVELQAVVAIDGTVSDARVVRPLHPELDEQALEAVKAWRFVPGTLNGKPAPVLVEIEMTFALSSRR